MKEINNMEKPLYEALKYLSVQIVCSGVMSYIPVTLRTQH